MILGYNVRYRITAYVVIFTVLFSRISRVRPRENFHFNIMFIYCNENIRKNAKLSPREFSHVHVVQNHEIICTRKLWRMQYYITHTKIVP